MSDIPVSDPRPECPNVPTAERETSTGQRRHELRVDHLADGLETAVSWAETTVAFILALVIVVSVVFVLKSSLSVFSDFVPESLNAVIKAVLDTFIVIELFRITIAYVRHKDVIPTVLETALVVAAREIVVIEAGASEPLAAAAVGGTLLAVGVTWFLLTRSRTPSQHS